MDLEPPSAWAIPADTITTQWFAAVCWTYSQELFAPESCDFCDLVFLCLRFADSSGVMDILVLISVHEKKSLWRRWLSDRSPYQGNTSWTSSCGSMAWATSQKKGIVLIKSDYHPHWWAKSYRIAAISVQTEPHFCRVFCPSPCLVLGGNTSLILRGMFPNRELICLFSQDCQRQSW